MSRRSSCKSVKSTSLQDGGVEIDMDSDMWETSSDLSEEYVTYSTNSISILSCYPEASTNTLLCLILTLDRRYKYGEVEGEFEWRNFVKLVSHRIQNGKRKTLDMFYTWCEKYGLDDKDEIKF